MHGLTLRFYSHKSGFSLVELSIVLVILGLLTGGILAGQSLIRASEIRSAGVEYSKYITAVQTFRDKYFALPGDMSNAQKFWGVANASPATCMVTPSTGTETCNGNGDGIITSSDFTANNNEIFRFWQHLANAGLIEGSYDGITHGTTSYSATAANSPSSKISSSYWFVYNWTAPSAGSTNFFDGDYGNRLSMGGFTVNGEPAAVNMTPAELWNIDTKLDDGKPGLGKLVGVWPNCTDAANSATTTANYALSSNAVVCRPLFPRAF